MSGDVTAAYTAALQPVFARLAGWPDVDVAPPFTVEVRPVTKAWMTVERDGSVLVVVAEGAAVEWVCSFVARRIRWLAKHLATRAVRPVKQLVDGEGFDLLGRPNRLKVVDVGDPVGVRRLPIGDRGSMGTLPFLCLRRDHAGSAATLIGWYCEQGQAWVDEHMPAWAARMGVDVAVQVRDLGVQTWGRYYPRSHRVGLHWPLFQFPRRLVELTLVHELAHVAQPARKGAIHHREWATLMARTLPDWQDRKEEQVRLGRRLWWGDIAEPVARQPAPGRSPTLAELVFGTAQSQ